MTYTKAALYLSLACAGVLLLPGSALACGMVDVSVVKTGPATATPGGSITYDLAATESGPGIVSMFTVQDVIPAGLVYLPTQSNRACTHVGNEIRCLNWGHVDNSTVHFRIAFQIPSNLQCTTIRNVATVSPREHDIDLTNNTSNTVTTEILGCVTPVPTPTPTPTPTATLTPTPTATPTPTPHIVEVTPTPKPHVTPKAKVAAIVRQQRVTVSVPVPISAKTGGSLLISSLALVAAVAVAQNRHTK